MAIVFDSGYLPRRNGSEGIGDVDNDLPIQGVSERFNRRNRIAERDGQDDQFSEPSRVGQRTATRPTSHLRGDSGGSLRRTTPQRDLVTHRDVTASQALPHTSRTAQDADLHVAPHF